MKSHLRRQIRLTLFHWHRRSGVAAALIIVLVTLTGIALNHTGSLELDKHYPQSSWLLWPYESAVTRPDGVQIDSVWWWSDGEQLHRYQQPMMPCRALLGAASSGSEYLIQCDGEWLWLTSDGDLLDSLDPALLGLSLNAGLAADEAGFLVRSEPHGDWQRLDLDMYQLTPLLTESAESVSGSSPVPAALVLQPVPESVSNARNTSISWQRVLLDIHSGRWFGSLGPWLVDIAALVLLFLACSGFWIWYSRRH